MNRRVVALVVPGALLILVGVGIVVGFRTGTCTDGLASGSCVSGPDTVAVLVGAGCAVGGIYLVSRGVRRRG